MINNIQLINLPKIDDPRGNLTYFQSNDQIPFKIERVFWTYDVPGGQTRGGHAYYKQNELIIALSGSFDVITTKPNGFKKVYTLNRSYYGLLVPARIWRHLENFSTNALSLHASDTVFDESDYVRNYEDYMREFNE